MGPPRDADLGASVYIPRPQGCLRVITAGGTGTPVLLLSGAGNDNAVLSWRHALPALAREHRVFALDWPKQGASTPWHGVADHGQLLQCVTAVLDHFELDRIALVGLSQGGAVALAYTIEHPDRVSRLVVLAPAGIISFPPVVHQLLWLVAKLPALSRALTSVAFRCRAVCAWFARNALFAGPVDDFDDIVDEFHAEVQRGGAGASDWQNGSIGFCRMHVDLRPELPRIPRPVLFIQGSRDIAVKPQHTRAAADAVPGSRFELIDGAGHWCNRQEPRAVNHLIAEFLR